MIEYLTKKKLVTNRQKILEALKDGNLWNIKDLVNKVYDEDDGGPLWAAHSVRDAIKDMMMMGHPIEKRTWGPHSSRGYWIKGGIYDRLWTWDMQP